jgi:hypothetical protein
MGSPRAPASAADAQGDTPRSAAGITARHWPGRLGIVVAAGHRHLAIAHLAQGRRIPHTALDRDRGTPWLWKANIIEHQRPSARGRFGDQPRHPLPVEVL